jgi:hypothetical protein
MIYNPFQELLEQTNQGQGTGKACDVSRETRNPFRSLMEKHLVKHMRD